MKEPKLKQSEFMKEKMPGTSESYLKFREKFRQEEITEQEFRDGLLQRGVQQAVLDNYVKAELELAAYEKKKHLKKEQRLLPYRCPECGSSQTRYKSQVKVMHCYRCGHEWLREDLKKSEK